MPLNCTPKMVKMAAFMICIFYHNFFKDTKKIKKKQTADTPNHTDAK